MKVNTEIRDTEELSNRIKKILNPLLIWGIVTLGGLVIGANITYLQIIGFACFFAGLAAFIPMVIWIMIKANKGYKETWVTKEFEFKAMNNHIYLGDKKMHVNYNKNANEIYVHDMGDYKRPYDATFYGTVKGHDCDMFLKYLIENKVKIEKEHLERLPGKYGFLAPLGISKYRR